MKVQVYGGYLFPSDKLVAWKNEQLQPKQRFPPDDSGCTILIGALYRKFGPDKNGDPKYRVMVLLLGPEDEETMYLWVSTVCGDFQDVPPEHVKNCRMPEDLTFERTKQLRQFVEEEMGYNFVEHGVRWHNRRYIS